MILSFELPFALIPLLKFTSSKTKMGTHANSTLVRFCMSGNLMCKTLNTFDQAEGCRSLVCFKICMITKIINSSKSIHMLDNNSAHIFVHHNSIIFAIVIKNSFTVFSL